MTKDLQKIVINKYKQILISVLLMFCYLYPIYADMHIIYENNKNSSEKIEIFYRNSMLKVMGTDATVKSINLISKEAYFFKLGDDKFLQLQLSENKNKAVSASNVKKELFSPKFEMLKEKGKVAGMPTELFRFQSDIDNQVTVYANRLVPNEEIEIYKECLARLASRGMELLKHPAYYYALDSGFIPLRIRGRKMDWAATQVKTDEINEDTFALPQTMKRWETKDYYKFIVEKTGEAMDSRIKP